MKRTLAAMVTFILCLLMFLMLCLGPGRVQAQVYNLFFEESGLPTGSGWSVAFDNGTQSSNGSTIMFSVDNGNFAFSVIPPFGFVAEPASGNIMVNGTDVHQPIAFSPQYNVTIAAYDYSLGAYVDMLPIYLDGLLNNFTYDATTTFYFLSGSHTFGVPGTDSVGNSSGNPFIQWSTGESSTTITVSSGGTYIAYYQAAPPPTYSVTIAAHDNTAGTDVSVPITFDGLPINTTTPETFSELSGQHTFGVPSTDSSGHSFTHWSTGETSKTITVSWSGTYTALYQALPITSTSVVCSPNLSSAGSSVTCTANVSGSNPTGTVTWSTSSSTGNFSQSVCAISNGTCSTTYSDNVPGSATIAACYGGDSNNALSSGSTTLTFNSGPVYYSSNYTSVQAAIDAAPPNATVIIAPGFYTESLVVNKTLTIIGEKDVPYFSGGASEVYITLLSGASGSTVTGIEITNFNEGILLSNASNCRIYSNIMTSLGSNGILLVGNNASNDIIYNNIFQDVPTPINLTSCGSGNTIYGNIITSQTSVTLSVGADGNSIYANSVSANQILLNMSNSNGNTVYHNNFVTTTQITVLSTGKNTLDNGNPSEGNYWNIAPNIIGSNNTDQHPLMEPWPLASGHCVAVVNVVTSKTVIGQGFGGGVTVNVVDMGEYTETFNVTAYANKMPISTQLVSSLNATCESTLTFTWNTANLAKGNYTISAYAQPVEGQNDTSGNDFVSGTVRITIPGDVNGDFKVGLTDLVALAQAYSSKLGYNNWNPNADIDGNGTVGLSDLVILAQHYGQHYP